MKSFKCVQSMNDNLEACNKQQMQKGGNNFITTGRSTVLSSKKYIQIYSSSYFVHFILNLSGSLTYIFDLQQLKNIIVYA